MDAYKTIEEVWDWRKKAYTKLDNLTTEERIQEINKSGRKYARQLKLKTLDHELAHR
jgi:hypothetical protein